MKRAAIILIATAAILGGALYVTAAPESTVGFLDCYHGYTVTPLDEDGERIECVQPTTTTTTLAPSTTTSTTTTVAPTSSTSTTVAAPTTTLAPGVQFVEDFTTAESMTRFNFWVYHRNIDELGWSGDSGGTWTGDHDINCGTPDTQRPLRFRVNDNQAARVANSVYWCPNSGGHFMTAMGDVDNYSLVTASPKATFTDVTSVCVDVNLTDLKARKWWKIGVVTEVLYTSWYRAPTSAKPSGIPGFLVSDISAANLPTSLATSNRLFATWGGGGSAGYPGGRMKIGNNAAPSGGANPAPNDKAARYPVCLRDNLNGTVTFTVAGRSITQPGRFPTGAVRVVIADHNYTPDKDGVPQGHTWHWDNLIVR